MAKFKACANTRGSEEVDVKGNEPNIALTFSELTNAMIAEIIKHMPEQGSEGFVGFEAKSDSRRGLITAHFTSTDKARALVANCRDALALPEATTMQELNRACETFTNAMRGKAA